jgi:hypothetical protein
MEVLFELLPTFGQGGGVVVAFHVKLTFGCRPHELETMAVRRLTNLT